MKKQVERGNVDLEDVRKDNYLPKGEPASFGFKKRETKDKKKRRPAEASDGERDP